MTNTIHRSVVPFYVIFTLIGAIGFCIPLFIFMNNPNFSYLWMVYVGNSIFFLVPLFGVIFYEARREATRGFGAIVMSGIKIASFGTILSCIILLVLFLIKSQLSLQEAPANAVTDKSGGLRWILFVDAMIVNLIVGVLGAVIGAVAVKRNQKSALGK